MNETENLPQSEEPVAPPRGAQAPSRTAQVVLGLAILLCGMVIGASGTVILARRAIFHQPPGRPEQLSRAIVGRMARRLNLSQEQEKEVREIVREHMQRLGQIRDQAREDARRELDLLEEDVAKILTSEQARLWRAELKRMRRFAPPPPPRGRLEPREPDRWPDNAGPPSHHGRPRLPPD